MERLHRLGRRGLQRLELADRRTFGQGLPGKEGLAQLVRIADLRPRLLAAFGQHDRTFGIQRLGSQRGRGHHARQDLQALVQPRLGRAGQVELIDGLGRCRRRIGVRAEGRAQPLPDTLGLAIGHMLRSPEGQMLDQMGEAALRRLLVQRARIDPHPHRHLPGRHAVAAHREAQAVGQAPELPHLVLRQVRSLVEPGRLVDAGDRRQRGERIGGGRHDGGGNGQPLRHRAIVGLAGDLADDGDRQPQKDRQGKAAHSAGRKCHAPS